MNSTLIVLRGEVGPPKVSSSLSCDSLLLYLGSKLIYMSQAFGKKRYLGFGWNQNTVVSCRWMSFITNKTWNSIKKMLYGELFFLKLSSSGLHKTAFFIIHSLQQSNTRFLKSSVDMRAVLLLQVESIQDSRALLGNLILTFNSVPPTVLLFFFQKLLILFQSMGCLKTVADSVHKWLYSTYIFIYIQNQLQNSGLKQETNWL